MKNRGKSNFRYTSQLSSSFLPTGTLLNPEVGCAFLGVHIEVPLARLHWPQLYWGLPVYFPAFTDNVQPRFSHTSVCSNSRLFHQRPIFLPGSTGTPPHGQIKGRNPSAFSQHTFLQADSTAKYFKQAPPSSGWYLSVLSLQDSCSLVERGLGLIM